MKLTWRIACTAMIAVPLVWFSVSGITAQAPRQPSGAAWDEAGTLAFQPGGRPGPGPRGPEDRPPPRNDGFGPPEGDFRAEGPAGGRSDAPPPRREGPPPPHHGPGEGPRPPHPGLGGRGSIEHLQQVDPEMATLVEQDYKLEEQTHQLAADYRRATGAKQAEIRASLAEVVKEHFEARQNRRKLELKRLEDELTRLRESIESRTTARDEIVERRIAEILGEDELKF